MAVVVDGDGGGEASADDVSADDASADGDGRDTTRAVAIALPPSTALFQRSKLQQQRSVQWFEHVLTPSAVKQTVYGGKWKQPEFCIRHELKETPDGLRTVCYGSRGKHALRPGTYVLVEQPVFTCWAKYHRVLHSGQGQMLEDLLVEHGEDHALEWLLDNGFALYPGDQNLLDRILDAREDIKQDLRSISKGRRWTRQNNRQQILRMWNMALVLICYGRVSRNVGTLCRLVHQINHSCQPNCTICDCNEDGALDGGVHLVVKAIRDIRPGEELTVSYEPVVGLPFAERQRILLTKRGFRCQCAVCQSDAARAARGEIASPSDLPNLTSSLVPMSPSSHKRPLPVAARRRGLDPEPRDSSAEEASSATGPSPGPAPGPAATGPATGPATDPASGPATASSAAPIATAITACDVRRSCHQCRRTLSRQQFSASQVKRKSKARCTECVKDDEVVYV